MEKTRKMWRFFIISIGLARKNRQGFHAQKPSLQSETSEWFWYSCFCMKQGRMFCVISWGSLQPRLQRC